MAKVFFLRFVGEYATYPVGHEGRHTSKTSYSLSEAREMSFVWLLGLDAGIWLTCLPTI